MTKECIYKMKMYIKDHSISGFRFHYTAQLRVYLNTGIRRCYGRPTPPHTLHPRYTTFFRPSHPHMECLYKRRCSSEPAQDITDPLIRQVQEIYVLSFAHFQPLYSRICRFYTGILLSLYTGCTESTNIYSRID